MFLLNGHASNSLPISDRGLHYGDGLFETLEIYQGKPLFLAQHLQRLQLGCHRLKIPVFDPQLLTQEAHHICENHARGVLKIIVTRGSGGRGYRQPDPVAATRILGVYPYPDYPQHYTDQGVELTVCQHPVSTNPVLAGIKHLNRLDQVLARSEWQDERFQEGIMSDSQGFLIEGTMSNLFWLRDQTVFTPCLAQAGIDGIVRQWLISYLQAKSILVETGQFTLDHIVNAHEVWVTNSIIGIWPVKAINDQAYVLGPVVRQLQAAWQQARKQQLSC
ncbi:MAG: aminodeoxychorismate lyase [Methylococcaceae bacterium]|nr:aminodeoxychorismate lyase [Methylococcaceae bacterium]